MALGIFSKHDLFRTLSVALGMGSADNLVTVQIPPPPESPKVCCSLGCFMARKMFPSVVSVRGALLKAPELDCVMLVNGLS